MKPTEFFFYPLIGVLSATAGAAPGDQNVQPLSASSDTEILLAEQDETLIIEESDDTVIVEDEANTDGNEEAISIEDESVSDETDEITISDEEEPEENGVEGDAIVIDEDVDSGTEEAPGTSDEKATTSAPSFSVETGDEHSVHQEQGWTGLLHYKRDDFSFGLDDARIEFGRLFHSDSDVDTSSYGHLAFGVSWKPNATWETRLRGRLDGYLQTGDPDTDQVELDYGDSFVRYRAENYRLTAGTQTVIWGRIDEVPPTDRISRWDIARGFLDPLDERRRAMPAVRFERFSEGFKLDAVVMPVFRRANLPNKNNIWFPINQREGEIIGLKSTPFTRELVKAGSISNRTPSGTGGFGARLSQASDRIDYALTVQRARQSAPYYQFNPEVRAALFSGADFNTALASSNAATFKARYPRTWVLGGDLGFEAMNATWRFEAAWLSDRPVTRSDLRYDTVKSVNWATGVQFYPGDSEVRVNLQLVGNNMINAPDVLDQENTYNFNGTIEGEFANNRWRAKTRFFFGLDQKDIYINPEIAFIGWEPQEVYLALHYFDGNAGTIGGFYDDNSLVTLGWRASF